MNNSCYFNVELFIPKTGTYVISFEHWGPQALNGSAYLYVRGKGFPQQLDTNLNTGVYLNQHDIVEIFGELKGVEQETRMYVKGTTPLTYNISYCLYHFVKKDNHSVLKNESVCSHEWKLYQGLFDSYNYCVKCDVKDK